MSPASATKGAPRSRKGVSASPGSGGKRGPRDVKAVYGPQARVQCVCGRNTWAEGEALVPCNGGCGVLEHSACVLIPPEKEKGKEERPKSLSEMAAEYFCELCRLARGDPYLVTVSSPVPPTRLHKEYGGGMDSARQLVALSGFRIPKADMDLIARPDYLLQVRRSIQGPSLHIPLPFLGPFPTFTECAGSASALRSASPRFSHGARDNSHHPDPIKPAMLTQ